MKHRKFSMIEIIVVFAVSATMATMLITSIKTSKDIAKQANCMSNINQIRVITELYRKDNGKLPYSETWLTDFSFAADYINGANALTAFTCPGSSDADLTDESQLLGGTSYYYLPSTKTLMANLSDAEDMGVTLLTSAQLADYDQLVIYDKSPDHHNGKVNAAYLYSDDVNKASLEGQIVALSDVSALPTVDGSGNLELTDPEEYGILNINPAASEGNLFTLTDDEGNETTVRDDEAGVGKATSVTVKAKSSGRTLSVGGDTLELKTNATYKIEAADDDGYFFYELYQEGSGNGSWWLNLYKGEGGLKVTNQKTGEVTYLG
jgi:type II secretory pathway pseudopilin PulG